ncbi:MAG: hypothetical protein HYX63_05955 [Gammaproteobacteria bacterium]|nr:hypothetical protein [Gammaproteobacteria bacterium]
MRRDIANTHGVRSRACALPNARQLPHMPRNAALANSCFGSAICLSIRATRLNPVVLEAYPEPVRQVHHAALGLSSAFSLSVGLTSIK